LSKNIAFLESQNKLQLDTQLTTATKALPPEKDFSAILAVLSDSAIRSGVSLNDYTFQVGTIASSSAEKRPVSAHDGLPSITVNISISGKLSSMITFFTEMRERLPLSEIRQIEGSAQSATIIVEFYYKPFPMLSTDIDNPLHSLSVDEDNLLDQLSIWQQKENSSLLPVSVESGGAIPLF